MSQLPQNDSSPSSSSTQESALEARKTALGVTFRNGDYFSFYCLLFTYFPKQMILSHFVLVLFVLICMAFSSSGVRKKQDTAALPNKAVPVHDLNGSTATSAPEWPTLPIEYAFRNSQVPNLGRNTIQRLLNDKGLVMRLQLATGTPVSSLPITVQVTGMVRSASATCLLETNKITEVGWIELGDFHLMPGHTIDVSSPGYATSKITVRLDTLFHKIEPAQAVQIPGLEMARSGSGQTTTSNIPRTVQGNYYPMTDGNKWVYKAELGKESGPFSIRIAKHEVIDGVRLALLESTLPSGELQSEHLLDAKEGILRCRYMGLEVVPPVMVLGYPVKDQDEWQSDIKLGAETAKYKAKANFENITVPAGSFSTVRVDSVLTAEDGTISLSAWYASGVGPVKSRIKVGDENLILQLDSYEIK